MPAPVFYNLACLSAGVLRTRVDWKYIFAQKSNIFWMAFCWLLNWLSRNGHHFEKTRCFFKDEDIKKNPIPKKTFSYVSQIKAVLIARSIQLICCSCSSCWDPFKILLENSLNWKLSKLKVLKLKVAKTEGCQSWSCQNCQNCQNWKLLSC